VQKGVKGKMKMAKAAKAKAARFSKPVIVYLLKYLLVGILLGFLVFVPLFGAFDGSMVKVLYAGLSLISLLLGMRHVNRLYTKIDWANENRFGPEFLLTIGVSLLLAIGFFLVYRFLPMLFSFLKDQVSPAAAFSWLLASTAVCFWIPYLLYQVFLSTLEVKPREYVLWYYPKDYREQQPTWNRDKVVFANLMFNPTHSEPKRVKKIEAKLPLEANLGEIIYLFINDYNENKSPDDPIDTLRWDNDSLGWLFSVPVKIGKLKVGKRYLDPEITIEENLIKEQDHINFIRIVKDQD